MPFPKLLVWPRVRDRLKRTTASIKASMKLYLHNPRVVGPTTNGDLTHSVPGRIRCLVVPTGQRTRLRHPCQPDHPYTEQYLCPVFCLWPHNTRSVSFGRDYSLCSLKKTQELSLDEALIDRCTQRVPVWTQRGGLSPWQGRGCPRLGLARFMVMQPFVFRFASHSL